jgi:riboflavin synthase
MFTGLIETTGRIDAIDRDEKGGRLRVETALAAELHPGESVAVSGVCLTVTSQTVSHVTFDIGPITLEVTTLGIAAAGRVVNLERSLRAGDRLGGHFVLGHVDGTAVIRSFDRRGDSFWLEVALPATLSPYLVSKGSIALDGISLTVAELGAEHFSVQIVPFTRTHTALGEAKTGDLVNVEVDVLGKYVARLLAPRLAEADCGRTTLGVPDAFARVLSGDLP